jgi:hypothetical protein
MLESLVLTRHGMPVSDSGGDDKNCSKRRLPKKVPPAPGIRIWPHARTGKKSMIDTSAASYLVAVLDLPC